MSDPQTTNIPTFSNGNESQEFQRMVTWFNKWLEVPLSDREKTIIDRFISYSKDVEAVRGRY